jgi:hypothetical protein
MGDLLEDDFDDHNLINNYENDDDDDSDADNGDDFSDDDQQSPAVGQTTDSDSNKLNKKLKRKEKFNEMKLKKRQRLEDEAPDALSSSSTTRPAETSMTASEQFELCLTSCGPFQEFPFQESHFLHIPSVALSPEGGSKKRKNPFVHAIESALPSFHQLLKSPSSTPGSPYVIIVCAAAGRAAEVINLISSQLKCKIGKLFAKHFKVQDQVEALRQHFPIVVGTPNRLSKLMELGALSLTDTQLLLVDMELDLKSFSILNLPGVCQDFSQFLCCGAMVAELDHLHVSLIRGGSDGETSESKTKKKPNQQQKRKGPPKRVGFSKKKSSS